MPAVPSKKSCPTCLAPSRHISGGAWRCKAGHTFAGPIPPAKPPRSTTSKDSVKTQKQCKDCVAEGITANRPAPHPGPRCYSHHQVRRRDLRLQSKENRVTSTYSISKEQYDEQYAAQDGKCFGCRRATGTTGKRLSVDHDHKCCIGPKSCGRCVRGLLCDTCNNILAHFRDSPEAFMRMAEYLVHWPTVRSGVVPPPRHIHPLMEGPDS